MHSWLYSLQEEDGGTVLSVASRQGDTQIVLLLLAHGAIVDHQDNVSVDIVCISGKLLCKKIIRDIVHNHETIPYCAH